MIVVRDIFQLHFGKAREAIALFKEGRDHLTAIGYPVDRILTDVTGDYYTLVMESRFENLAAFEATMGGSPPEAWQQVYARIVPLVRSGKREIFREVA